VATWAIRGFFMLESSYGWRAAIKPGW